MMTNENNYPHVQVNIIIPSTHNGHDIVASAFDSRQVAACIQLNKLNGGTIVGATGKGKWSNANGEIIAERVRKVQSINLTPLNDDDLLDYRKELSRLCSSFACQWGQDAVLFYLVPVYAELCEPKKDKFYTYYHDNTFNQDFAIEQEIGNCYYLVYCDDIAGTATMTGGRYRSVPSVGFRQGVQSGRYEILYQLPELPDLLPDARELL